MSEYEKPEWCSASTWENAKVLVFKLVPQCLMDRTGQKRIEIAAKAIQGNREVSDDEVERVARAIYEADDPWSEAFPWPTMGAKEQTSDNYRRVARAAIEELRK